MKNNVFMLYASCVMVKGHQRTAVYDLQRSQIHFIPNSLAAVFIEDRYLQLEHLVPNLDSDSIEILFEYLNLLLDEELGFYCTTDEIPLFPKLETSFRFPSHITNCILDAVSELWYFNTSLLDQLNILCCDFIQIRFFGNVQLDHLKEVTKKISESHLKNVEIILPANPKQYKIQDLLLISRSSRQIHSWIHYNDSINVIHEPSPLGVNLIQTATPIKDETHCGQVAQAYFTVNKLHYFESRHHNTCLNRKISIDQEGYIKNCPSMKESFGNIRDTTLAEAINKPGFTKYWNITKDQIAICKDCEFRHICTDCRAYLEEPEDEYSKPLKCGYDPYTCEWEEWSTNPLKQKAIDVYHLRKTI